MIPKRPYFFRAFYDWITDNGLTPHLVVDAEFEGVDVPRAYVENGKIILNASLDAVRGLVLEDEYVSFSARFGGKPYDIYLPIYSILGIYAMENGEGIVLAELDGGEVPPVSASKPPVRPVSSSNTPKSPATVNKNKKKRPSHLRVVK